MKQETLVSGIRATGNLHVGNYLGALKQFIELQKDYNSFYFIANLHALTTLDDPKELNKNTINVVADYLAAGLDPKQSTIFLQSHIPEHAELAWIFNCITPLGELYRMTQFKDKAENKETANAGLLTYPVLMAADILLYKPQVVPVGEDQVQHVELTRVIARKFNHKVGETFPEPKSLLTKGARVKSLLTPEKKMSKSNDEPIYLTDEPETIAKKLKKAVTATDASGSSAGVENLLLLLREFGTQEQMAYFETAQKANTIKYSELKETLAHDISEYFAEFREKRKEYLAQPDTIARILHEGAEKAKVVARETLAEVKAKSGLF